MRSRVCSCLTDRMVCGSRLRCGCVAGRAVWQVLFILPMLVPSVSLGTRLVHLLSTLTLSVPGLVLGLAYVLAFKQSPLYETMGILILSSTVHFFHNPVSHALPGIRQAKRQPGRHGASPRYSSRSPVCECVFAPVRRNAGGHGRVFLFERQSAGARDFILTEAPAPACAPAAERYRISPSAWIKTGQFIALQWTARFLLVNGLPVFPNVHGALRLSQKDVR